MHRLVEGISLHGRAPSLADGFFQFRFRLKLRLSAAGHAENMLLEDRAVNVIGPVVQGDLGQLEAQPYSVRRNMREVIEVNPRNSDRAERIVTAWLVADWNVVIFRLEGKGNEADESVGFILKFA